MKTLIDGIHTIGMSSLSWFWVPLLAWTLLALPIYGGLRFWRTVPPMVQYRSRQALLAALPLGMVGSILSGAFGITGWLASTSGAASLPGLIVLPSPPALPSDGGTGSTLSWTFMHTVGLATLVAGSIAFVRLFRIGLHARALAHFHQGLNASTDDALQQLVTREAAHMGVRRPVTVALTPQNIVPLTYGTFRPMIVVPASLTDDVDALRMALRHEFVHIQRYDCAARWIEQGIAALFAIHPGVAYLARSIEQYREIACDAEVLRDTRTSRRRYADLLYGFAELPPRRGMFAVSIIETSSSIKARISAMTHNVNIRSPRFIGLASAALVLVVMIGVVACSDLVGAEKPSAEATNAQTQKAGEGEVFVVVEQRPEPIGGIESLQKKVKYPESAKEAGIEGRVFVQFVVDEQGNVQNPHVIRGAHALLNEEAVRVVRQMKFESGRQRGKPVKVQMALPITFKLPKEESTTTSSGNQRASEAEAGPLQADNRRMSFRQLRFDGDAVTGRVVDAANGQPLAGTNIHVPNMNKGTTTRPDGSFTLRAEASSIVASFVGYESIEAHR